MAKKVVLNRQYTDEFKQEAVRLAEAIGGNQAAKRLGIPDASAMELGPTEAQRQVGDCGSRRDAGQALGERDRGRERPVTPGVSQHQA